MRRALLIAAGVAVVALVLGIAAFTRSSAQAAKPSLRITRPAPFTVQGRHFRAGEKVRLLGGSHRAQVRANGDGSFAITIAGATRCDTLRLVARGSAGSYAVVKLLPPPACAATRSSG
jgi:hypothetical protein